MPRSHKTRFNKDTGEQCPTDPKLLKLHPECATIINRDTFIPIKPQPKPKPHPPHPHPSPKPLPHPTNPSVSQFDMHGLKGPLDRNLPNKKILPPSHPPSKIKKLTGDPVALRLSQDSTNQPLMNQLNNLSTRMMTSNAFRREDEFINRRLIPSNENTRKYKQIATSASDADAIEMMEMGLDDGFEKMPAKRATTFTSPKRPKRFMKDMRNASLSEKRSLIFKPKKNPAIEEPGKAGLKRRFTRKVEATPSSRFEEIEMNEVTYEFGGSDVTSSARKLTFADFDVTTANRPFKMDEYHAADQMVDVDLNDGAMEPFRFSKLKIAEPISMGITAADVGSTAGGVGLGLATHIALQQTGINRFANDGISGGVGDVGGRIIAMAAQRAAGRAATTTLARAAAMGLVEGAGIGVVAGLADYGTEKLMIDTFHTSHAAAGAAGGLAGGASATALTAIAAIALGTAPETLGASLIIAGLLTVAGTAAGAIMGGMEDADIKKQEEKVQHAIDVSTERQKFLKTLPKYGYNFEMAIAEYNIHHPDSDLGYDDDTWDDFQRQGDLFFIDNPKNAATSSSNPDNPPKSPTKEPSDTDKKITKLMVQYVQHGLKKQDVDYSAEDPGALTAEDRKFLDEKTNGVWEAQGNVQIEMSKQNMVYTRQRIGNAQGEMWKNWTTDQTMPDEMDKNLTELAYLDTNFEENFNTLIKEDAQDRVVDAYYEDQTKFDDLSENIQKASLLDPSFADEMDEFYKKTEDTAADINVDVPQLIELQGLKGGAQKSKYANMQFDRIKEQDTVVQSAQRLAAEQDLAVKGEFYDLDARFLDLRDPTQSWQPSDSQILQAHKFGMNLNQYKSYIHELAKGDAGDFDSLPKYTQDQLKKNGIEDADHLKEELKSANMNPKMYTYDKLTRQFTFNQTNEPSSGEPYVSKYTPEYLIRDRQEYADMIHTLNEKNKAEVDEVNAQILAELSVYGRNYNQSVTAQNTAMMNQVVLPSHLLHYSVQTAYNQNKVTYEPLSDKLYDLSKNESIQSKSSEINDEVSAKKLGLNTAEQYRSVQDELASNNQLEATQEEVQQAVDDTKQYGTETPLRGS